MSSCSQYYDCNSCLKVCVCVCRYSKTHIPTLSLPCNPYNKVDKVWLVLHTKRLWRIMLFEPESMLRRAVEFGVFGERVVESVRHQTHPLRFVVQCATSFSFAQTSVFKKQRRAYLKPRCCGWHCHWRTMCGLTRRREVSFEEVLLAASVFKKRSCRETGRTMGKTAACSRPCSCSTNKLAPIR